DRGGRSLTLRPEGTAGALRASLGAHLDQEVRPVRVHYAGPFFRAERPQAGRQHQFTQVGIECIGEGSPALDAEIVEVAWRFFAALGITGIRLQVNSLGGPEDRAPYRTAPVHYYSDTVFEFWHDTLQGAQSSLGGGGRYDGLAELLGFPETPATGYALGVERILMAAGTLGT